MPENPLATEIRARITREGAMPFRDFMQLALYDPEHGYYASGRAAIGREGDYFTSVSVGPVFGRLLGFQFREMWERLGRCEPFTVVEQGANDGAFAADVLEWAREEAPDFFAALRYEIVEGFAPLRERQAEKLAGFAGSVTWRPSLEELPPFTGVHFSNELVDAFPVHLVRFWNGKWHERHVDAGLGWVDLPVENPALASRLAGLPRIEGYVTEISLEALQWAEAVSAKLGRGWVVAIDYGFPRESFYSGERLAGTLQAYAGHARVSFPLLQPGLVDLTAHVEFTSLAEAFQAQGLALAGYTDQHHFLVGLAAQALPRPDAKQARGLKTLLHPEMLGSSFQVLVMARRIEPGPPLAGLVYTRDAAAALGLGAVTGSQPLRA